MAKAYDQGIGAVGFNGAATSLLRNARRHQKRRQKRYGFNGAATSLLRNDQIRRYRYKPIDPLQWGRNITAAE